MVEVTIGDIENVLTSMEKSFDDKLIASMTQEHLDQYWFWKWDDKHSIEWNTYEFFELLELYRKRCRKWENHHHGYVCIVERVRDKYLYPKIQEFLKILKEKQ